MRRLQGQILRESKLRSTLSRYKILGLFIRHEHAQSYADIEQQVNNSIDRVTIYRTLKTFLDKGIIHKILDDQGQLKYGLCPQHCLISGHHHDHVHFKCTECGQTSCLDQVEIPGVTLPKGYQVTDMDMLIQGICEYCG